MYCHIRIVTGVLSPAYCHRRIVWLLWKLWVTFRLFRDDVFGSWLSPSLFVCYISCACSSNSVHVSFYRWLLYMYYYILKHTHTCIYILYVYLMCMCVLPACLSIRVATISTFIRKIHLYIQSLLLVLNVTEKKETIRDL